QTINMMAKGIDSRGGDDPRLSHGAAKELLVAASLGDELLRTGQYRTDRAAKPLCKIEPHGVEISANLARRRARGDRRVHEPGAIQMYQEAMLARDIVHGADLVEGPNRATAHVVRVFEANESRTREMGIVRAQRRCDGGRCENPVTALQQTERRPRVHRWSATFEMDGMAVFLDDDFVTGPTMHGVGDHVAHRARRKEETGLQTSKLGHHALEKVDGRVLTLLFVADFCFCHK